MTCSRLVRPLPCEMCGNETSDRQPVIADVDDVDGARSLELMACSVCVGNGEGWPTRYRGTTCWSTIRELVAS